MYPTVLNDKAKTLKLITDRLGTAANNFTEHLDLIRQRRKQNVNWLAAGVILLLHHRNNPGDSSERRGEFVFQLIKRSENVPQGGDLSCPGGILEPSKDRLICRLMVQGFPPIMQGEALSYAQKRQRKTFLDISLFTANAVRESWEETGLSPFNVTFLGPLPCYNLTLFTKTIFPVVGLVEKEAHFRINGGEVEKIVEIPLKAFFDEENYAIYSLDAADDVKQGVERAWDFPCLIHHDSDGNEEILWGATFNIVTSFFKIVFDFNITDIHPTRIITRMLHPRYLTGK